MRKVFLGLVFISALITSKPVSASTNVSGSITADDLLYYIETTCTNWDTDNYTQATIKKGYVLENW